MGKISVDSWQCFFRFLFVMIFNIVFLDSAPYLQFQKTGDSAQVTIEDVFPGANPLVNSFCSVGEKEDFENHAKKFLEIIHHVGGNIKFTKSDEISHFRNGMALVRHEISVPCARLSPEYIEDGRHQRLYVQKQIFSPTFLSVIPVSIPSSFEVTIVYDKYKRIFNITRYHTVEQTIEDLIKIDEDSPSPQLKAWVNENGYSLNQLSLRIAAVSDYYFPFELVSSKASVCTALISSGRKAPEFALVSLADLPDFNALPVMEEYIKQMDALVTVKDESVPYIPLHRFPRPWEESNIKFISSWDANIPYSFVLVGVEGLEREWSEKLNELISVPTNSSASTIIVGSNDPLCCVLGKSFDMSTISGIKIPNKSIGECCIICYMCAQLKFGGEVCVWIDLF
jgi:hypothetical protein